MNKSYKSIFNQTTGAYVAVSETAKSKTKGAALIASILLSVASMSSHAAPATAVTKQVVITNNGSVQQSDGTTYTAAEPNAVEIGKNAQALAAGSIAIGANSLTSSATDNIAIGTNASATASANVAVGAFSSVSGNSSVAFGYSTIASGATAVAVGALAKASSTSDIAVGYNAQASGSGSIALGQGAISSGFLSTAVGNQAVASGSSSSAFGNGASASGSDSVASGALSIASAGNTSVLGYRAEATKTGATAVGTRSKATETNSTTLGVYSQATFVNSVALGAYSITDTNSVYSKTSTNNGIIFGNYAGTVNNNTGRVVSVGAAGSERQIKNVGSGVVSATSTDAINGSQLYATNVVLGNAANSVQTILGGNAKLNSDGNITMTNIGGTGKNTIHDAIAASQEEVVAGTNIARVIKTTDATGVDTFTVNANGTTVSAAASGALTVVKSLPDANNVTDYSVDLSQTTKDKIDGALQEVVTQIDGTTVKTITKSNNTANFLTGKNIKLTPAAGGIEIATADNVAFTNVNTTNLNTTGVTNLGGTTNITGDAYYTGPITNGNNIVNKTYVDNSVTTLANNPLTFAGDTGTDVARKLGETLNIVGGNTGTLTDGNIGIEGNGTDTLTVKLASDLAGLNSVSIVGGPTINNGGIDMGDTKITNLTAGDVNSTSTDAVNGSQLYAVSEVANKGHNVTTAATGTGKATGSAVTNVAPGDTVTYTAGNNIEVTQNGKEIQIATSLTPTFTTVNTTNLTTTGVTNLGGTTNITGDAYYTGPITNGDNIVNKTYVDKSVTTLANNPLTFAGDTGTDVARKLGETLNIVGGNTTGTLTDGNIGVVANGSDTLTVKLASDLAGLNSITINGGPIINGDGIDMGGDKITNLAAGDVNSTSTDAVNGSQLYAVSEVANKGHNVTTAATGTGTVTGTAVTNVAPGDTVTYTAGNNIEVTQNGKEIQIATSLTPTFTTVNTTNLTVTGETKLEGDTYLSGDTYYTGPITNGDNIVNKTYVDNSVTTLASNPLTFAGDTGTDVARKLGETLNIVGGNTTGTLTDGNIGVVANGSDTLTVKLASDLAGLNSITINGGPTINSSGIDMGGDKITNLTAGDVNSTSTDAVNGSQLYAVSEVANKGHNVTTAATGTGTVTGTAVTNVAPGDTVTYTAGNNIEVTQVGKEIQIATSLTPTFTTVNTTNLTTTGVTNLGGTTNITGDAYYTGPITNGDNIVNKTYVDNSVTTLASNPLTFAGDTGTDVARKLGETLNIVGGNTTGTLTDGNIGVVANGSDTLTVKLASDLAGLNSITINGGPTINSSGIDMGGDKITNLAAGVADTDAVNVSQLKEVSNVANAGWNIATDSGTAEASNVKPGDTVNMKGDGSVVVSNKDNDVIVGLADVVTVGQGDTAVTIDGTKGTIQAGTKVTIDGNTGVIQAGDVTIDGDKGTVNGLSNITWDADNIVSGQAATEDQLKAVADNVTTAVGAAKTEVKAGKNVTVSSALGDKGQTIYTVATKDEVDFNKVTVGGLTIDKGNVDANDDTIISGVGKGELSSTSTDAVNGSQLYATNQKVTQNTTDITNINTTLDKGLNFSADSGTTVNRKLGDTVAITGDKNIVTTTTANGVQIKLSDNIDVNNVNVSQNFTVSEGANVNMGGNVIQNVGAGVADTDAVNVGQLKNVANHIGKVEDKLSGGIAASAALAVVTPVEPGTYHLSGGAAYYNGGYGVGFNLLKRSDNGRTTMHAGVGWGSGGGGALVRVGAGFSFGGN